MTLAVKKLAEQALALTLDERESLVDLLQASLPQDSEAVSQEDWDEAWKKEINARIEEMESGEDPGVPLDEILADLEKPIRNP